MKTLKDLSKHLLTSILTIALMSGLIKEEVITLTAAQPQASVTQTQSKPSHKLQDVAESVIPSVVTIQSATGEGSGIIMDEEGYITIVDRKKDIIVTANGKNVAPQLIESRVGQDYYVEQMVVFGDRQKYLTALIVPAFPALEEYAQSKGIAYKDLSDLIKKPEIIQLYADRIEGQSKDLARHEKIAKFTLLDHPFTIESGEMTPSNKLKRKVIAQHYEDVIQNMYE